MKSIQNVSFRLFRGSFRIRIRIRTRTVIIAVVVRFVTMILLAYLEDNFIATEGVLKHDRMNVISNIAGFWTVPIKMSFLVTIVEAQIDFEWPFPSYLT